MSWEVERHRWERFRAAGGASGIPAALRALESATDAEAAQRAYWRIDNTVIVQGAVYKSALTLVPCLLDSLFHCTVHARPRLLELLVQISGGEPGPDELAIGNTALVAACRTEIARGVPFFAFVLEHSEDLDARISCVDLLMVCCDHEPTLQERVRWYLQAALARETDEGVRGLIERWLQGER